MHVHLVAGEISGDTHAKGMLQALQSRVGDLRVTGLAGPETRADFGAGVENWVDRAAVVGLWEVLRQYGYFRQKMRQCVEQILAELPAAVILVDYPGFNLRLAKALRSRGYAGRIINYISPQVWAWKKGRVKTMARTLDLVLCLFPFEVAFYQQSGLQAKCCGHPMLDRVLELPAQTREVGLVGWFPGSRRHEVRRHLPLMLAAGRRLKAREPLLRFVVVAAHQGIEPEIAQVMAEFGSHESLPHMVSGSAQSWMQRVEVAAIASGTATLEAACLGLPFALVYRVHPLTYWVAKWVVKLRWIGMANILVGREVVRELVQDAFTAEALAAEVLALRGDETRRRDCLEGLAQARGMLGDGDAYGRTAEAVLECIASSPG